MSSLPSSANSGTNCETQNVKQTTSAPECRRFRIRTASAAKGWSQGDLARELQLIGWDVERTVVTEIELHCRCVTDSELITIAKVLQHVLDELARGARSLQELFRGDRD